VSCIIYESVRWDGASANTSRFQPSPFLLHNVPNLVCLLDDTILISIVHPECRESQHASGRAHAGRCSKLLTNCSPPARRPGWGIGLVWSLQPLNASHRRQANLFPFPSQQYIPWPAIYERQLPLVDVILQLLCPIRSGPRQHGRRHRKR
jgi:hypothetical protein